MHIAIIAEYNPFHEGHAYQLKEVRRHFGENCTVSIILGGIFSQRGEPYVAPPYVRAHAALLGGADLVVEMPFPFSASPASVFARAGVEIAEKIGADVLAFGSECGSLDTLYSILERLDGDELRTALEQKSKEGDAVGKTRVFADIFKELYGSENRLDMPNDILGIEYLRAIKALGAKIKPFTILRKGDYKSGEGEFTSASSLRKAYKNGGMPEIRGGMPKEVFDVFLDAEKNGLFAPDIEKLAGAALLKLNEEHFCDIAFSGSGIIGRLKSAAKGAKTISELLRSAATKRYTDAELSRALLYTLFSVKRNDLDEEVRYTKVLALNARGREILAKNLKIELVTKPSDLSKLSEGAKEQYSRTFTAERAYALCLSGCYEAMSQSPKVIK